MRTYSFEKLEVWQKARKLTNVIYLTSKNFPDEEKFGLTSQIRRAAVSVCSNIAEGTSRNSFKDKARFTEMSYTSLMEVLNQLIISSDLSFIAQEQYESLRTQIDEVSYMINALHKSQLNSIK
ncbi:MAG: four helix bundle protein [Bacteroidetes bacterium HGW-Bacteroidetes-12]|nr:MAG: four helix bundle protein [Bacteroidetes bacterium HGW-Bacteroidetes-12]